MFMENNPIMPPEIKFDPLKRRNKLLDIFGLFNDNKSQTKNWKIRINSVKTMVTGLIRINNIIAEISHSNSINKIRPLLVLQYRTLKIQKESASIFNQQKSVRSKLRTL